MFGKLLQVATESKVGGAAMKRRLFTALFRFRRKEERPSVVYPFRPWLEAMAAKDPDLRKVVGPLSPGVGINLWREKYPEDMRNGGWRIMTFAEANREYRHCQIGAVYPK